MRFIDHDDVFRTVSPAEAVEKLRQTLAAGFDPATDPLRTKVPLPHGEMHLMPSAAGTAVGVKILGIQPAGSTVDVPLVQGSYLLMDSETLTPHTLIDATALTTLRTPAASIAGVLDRLTVSNEPLDVAIFGNGAQGLGHAATLESVLDGVREPRITFISRTEPADLAYPWAASGSAAAQDALARAGLVITATTSPEPIVTGAELRKDATVLAVGAHTADARELAADVFTDAQVIVEDPTVAYREGGDVVLATEEGTVRREDLITMAQVVRGEVALDPDRRVVFKTVGMPWQDLATAQAVAQAAENPLE
ncbi:ornithine cyclodeaminase family protein [Corynebacterium gottingense]|uniref:Ornithine cyclodeaminase family protein n=1 Tax=Corynebacterium gottingense TaxID=2041036 RepID=A0ABX9UKZ6_9CORY|nr:ornithine cyclodeaminase family protein [Corynebacterium gottingense]RMD19851.1 ornithine cyclodeaminase family protein [Corynebacterium gottingense]WJZ13595.1 ornithine cyclodeaminase [Corynebacterium gottingense]WJZ15913.1 ornithine cyclodeaminase [Corynebacterium gottingense]